ncbi:hypothetical protein GCM10022202_17510 [Microbacterium marinilacus]|uniref:Uncharacterized protein n=2 Tax=Microbacterium marinilacus TaxID=415209 RepID=A0ABP7BG51_9MICO
MVSLFSAVLSEVRVVDGEEVEDTPCAWSIGGGRGRHDLMRKGSTVGQAPLATVHFARNARRITDAADGTVIATARRDRLVISGPVLPPGDFAVRPQRVLRGLLESSRSFVARQDETDVLVVRETTHTRRTVRSFDVRMHDGLDPNVGLSLLLLFGAVDRQRVLGELFEHV